MSTDDIRDRGLWVAARNGSDTAFAELYRRHTRGIASYCFRRTASWETAQDLTSIVFLEMWRRRGELDVDEDGSIAPVLFGIANNVVRNSERARRRYASALSLLPATLSERDHADDVATRLDAEHKMRVVVRCLDQLRRSDREILTLAAWGGLNEQQLATALDVPRGTVKSRLSRARQRLSKLTAEDHPHPHPRSRIDDVAAHSNPTIEVP